MRRADDATTVRESGQASVEFALVLPVIALSAWLVVAVAAVSVRHLEVLHTARVAARAATLEPTEAATQAAAERATGLRPLHVKTMSRAGLVTVTVSVPYRVPLPMPGAWRPSITLAATVTMAVEAPTQP